MKKIRSSKKGFTLAELLVVVAIIAVLVGVSVPIFTAQLEKSRESTDLANARAAKAAAVAAFLGNGETTTKTYYYDAVNGAVKNASTGITGYGKGTTADGGNSNAALGYVSTTAYTDEVCNVTITPATDGSQTVTIAWAAAS